LKATKRATFVHLMIGNFLSHYHNTLIFFKGMLIVRDGR